MQLARPLPTRRLIIFSLVLCVTGLTGCGGGGGSSASVPPETHSINNGNQSILDKGRAASLFNTIDGQGNAWLSLVDADSGLFPLTGNSPQTNEVLDKLPEADAGRTITRQFSSIAYIPPHQVSPLEPGRYLLFGRLASQASGVGPNLSYTLSGYWSCVGCGLSVARGALTGDFSVNTAAETGRLSLSDSRLSLTADVSLDKNSVISGSSGLVVRFDGAAVSVTRSRVGGGLFGEGAAEAGVLFGLTDEQSRIFSGGASGVLD